MTEERWSVRESRELQAEYDRLVAAVPVSHPFDRNSWMKGAMYALAWVIHRRGAAVAPLDAAGRFIE